MADRRRFRARLAMSAGALPRRSVAFVAALVLAAVGSGFAFGSADPGTSTSVPSGYPSALVAAAGAIDAATAPGASGYTFEVVQRQVLHAKAGGPRIAVPDPSDPTVVAGYVDAHYVMGVTSRGAVIPGAFWQEIRGGPGEDQPPAFDGSPLFFGVVQREGRLWRTDGEGWYETDVSPGNGMDPLTAARLPGLLRRIGAVRDIGFESVDGVSLHHYAGSIAALDDPGVAASDGFLFTSSSVAVDVWLDAANRLVRLHGQALNLNVTTYELVIDTTVTFGYGPPGAPPEPVPTLAPSAAPVESVAP